MHCNYIILQKLLFNLLILIIFLARIKILKLEINLTYQNILLNF